MHKTSDLQQKQLKQKLYISRIYKKSYAQKLELDSMQPTYFNEFLVTEYVSVDGEFKKRSFW